MRLLTSLFALLALVCGASAQTQTIANQFPVTALTFSVLGTVDGSSLPAQSYSAGSPQLVPRFDKYNQKSLRYAVEVTSQVPINVRFAWSATGLPNTAITSSSIKFRNCGTTLLTPTVSNTYSYCSFVGAGTSFTQGTNIDVNSLYGSAYLEFQTQGIVNYAVATISYVVFVGVYTGTGSNMITLDTDYLGSSFSSPYTQQTSQYTIGYTIQAPSGSNYMVPFYFATQTSVTTVFVQECPGISCSNCDVNAISQRQVIAGVVPSGFSAINQGQLDLPNGNIGSGSAGLIPKHGKYLFPAVLNAANCLRFINRVDAGAAGTNEYTITIGLQLTNCGAYTTCSTCAAQAACGWCLPDNFVQVTGYQYCRVGHVQALTTDYCVQRTDLVVPRYIVDPTKCQIIIKGDPRISGLQGQDFQVHGTPNEYFNLVSTPSLQVNSRFVFLDEAKCDNFTACFTHPGTYIDEIGVMMGENKVRLAAGAIAEAARVFINGKEVSVSAHKHSAGQVTVTFANARRVVIKTPEFMMTVSQSDKFFNVESALLKTELLDQGSKLVKLSTSRAAEANTVMHGLIGQTWRNNVYAGDREYEGEVTDYQVADGIWGKDFAFNLYQN